MPQRRRELSGGLSLVPPRTDCCSGDAGGLCPPGTETLYQRWHIDPWSCMDRSKSNEELDTLDTHSAGLAWIAFVYASFYLVQQQRP